MQHSLTGRKDEDETEALRNNVLSGVRDHSRWLRRAERVQGTALSGSAEGRMERDEEKEWCQIGSHR